MSNSDLRIFRELGGDLPGERLCTLLQAIAQTGSINRAAAELKMSYRYAWGLIKSAEERLSGPLLAKRVGGVTGGGAELTDAGRRLINDYRRLRANVDSQVGRMPSPGQGTEPEPGARQPVLMSTTIGPVEAGLVPALEAAFLEATGIAVRHIAAGSGQALQIAREGRVDVALTHAPHLESAFLAEGYGVGRYPLMYNDFVLLGPAADPAGVSGAGSAREAFRRCAEAQAPFLTRGDQSGTHLHEAALWEAAGVHPTAPWYQVCSRGPMGSMATLRAAEQEQAYVLVDRATYLAARTSTMSLKLLFAGDPELRNAFALVLVNPDRFPQVQRDAALRFVTWAAGAHGQSLIGKFGADQFGEPLFLPASV